MQLYRSYAHEADPASLSSEPTATRLSSSTDSMIIVLFNVSNDFH